MTPKNRQAKDEWLAKKFAHILRYNPNMKPLRLQDEVMDIRGVKWSFDQAYITKRKGIELIHWAGRDQFTHLRSYAQELLNSNQNSTVVIRCSNSSNDPVFERVYTGLEACKVGFAMTCRPLIGICMFFERRL